MTKEKNRITESELDAAAELIAEKRETEAPFHLSDVIDFEKIYHVKGKSGLWQPFKVLNANGGRKVFAFLKLGDPKIRTSAFKGAQSIGVTPSIIAAYDIAYIRGMEPEDTISTIEGLTSGQIKTFSGYYREIVSYYEGLMSELETEIKEESE